MPLGIWMWVLGSGFSVTVSFKGAFGFGVSYPRLILGTILWVVVKVMVPFWAP